MNLTDKANFIVRSGPKSPPLGLRPEEYLIGPRPSQTEQPCEPSVDIKSAGPQQSVSD